MSPFPNKYIFIFGELSNWLSLIPYPILFLFVVAIFFITCMIIVFYIILFIFSIKNLITTLTNIPTGAYDYEYSPYHYKGPAPPIVADKNEPSGYRIIKGSGSGDDPNDGDGNNNNRQ